MRYVGLVLIVIIVVGAFNAAGDIGPAIDLLAFLFVLGIVFRRLPVPSWFDLGLIVG